MRRTLLLPLLAITTGACASVVHEDHKHVATGAGHYDLVVHGTHEHRVVGDGDRVTVTNVNSQDTGLSLANEYCGRLGKTAQFLRPVRYAAVHRMWDSEEFGCTSGR